MGNMGHIETERSQLHNKPPTLKIKEQRATSNYSHPNKSVVVYNIHQVS